MRRDYNERPMTQIPMTENQLGEIQLMEEVSEHVGMNYPESLDSKYLAQPAGRKQTLTLTLTQTLTLTLALTLTLTLTPPP